MFKCKGCGKTYATRVRIRSKEIICTLCGHVSPLPTEKKESEKVEK